jgi:hypothetical protein
MQHQYLESVVIQLEYLFMIRKRSELFNESTQKQIATINNFKKGQPEKYINGGQLVTPAC